MTAAEHLALIDAALEKNQGVTSVTIDGVSVSYNRQQLLDERKFWAREAARAAGTRPRVSQIDLRDS